MEDNIMRPSPHRVRNETLRDHIQLHMEWSMGAFGAGPHLEGLLKHIEKEVQEVREETDAVEQAKEIVDIIILSIDAIWRLGFLSEEVAEMLIEKQNINRSRKWPALTDPDQPTEHIKEE